MFTPRPLPSVEYYLRGAEAAQINYYSGADAAAKWWCPSDEHASTFGIESGMEIDADLFRSLCFGVMPDGRRVATKGYARRPGYDLHFAPPKSVSVVALLSSPEKRDSIINAHDIAVRRALKFVFTKNLLHVRRGHAGAEREAPAAWVAAVFRELTSRANDPQLHSHCVVPNTALRTDGTLGALNNEGAMDFQLLVGAIYRAELAARLRQLGYPLERTKKHFEIAGFPKEILVEFSKRRQAIEIAARAEGIDPTKDRAAAQRLALATRPKKSTELGAAELEDSWQEQLMALGFDLDVVIGSALRSSGKPEVQTLKSAVESAFSKSAVLKRSDLFASAAEHLQCQMSADEIERLLDEQLPSLVQSTGPKERKDANELFSSMRIIEEERGIIRDARDGLDRWRTISAERIEQAIASRPTLSTEQAEAVRHALNTDQVCLVEGSAGAGKSFAQGLVAEIGRAEELTVHTLGPSWAATKVIAKDTKTAPDKARALAGFLLRVEAGKLKLDANTLIILDEAGMVPTTDMARLLQLVIAAGSKLILSGDAKQLPPVQAGAPFALLSRMLGSSRIGEIRRQTVPWQRAASMLFASGTTQDALRMYNDRGHIEWNQGRDAAIQALANRYIVDKLWDQTNGTDPEPFSLAIAGWNEDVLEINRQIRLRLQAAGLIAQHEVKIATGTKRQEGSRIETTTLSIAVGDRIVFGETVELSKRTINNADAATVVDVNTKALTFKLDDGQVFTAELSQLVGRRSENEPRVPLVRHAFCVTNNFAQGLTVDRAYVAAVRPMNRENMYVAMTRHRHAVQLFVDLNGVPHPQVKPNTFGVWLKKDERRLVDEQAALEARKTAFMRRCSSPAKKQNASDFASDLIEWAGLYKTSLILGGANDIRSRMNRRLERKLSDGGRLHSPSPEAGTPNSLYCRLVERSPRPRVLQQLAEWLQLLHMEIKRLMSSLGGRKAALSSDANSLKIEHRGVYQPSEVEFNGYDHEP